MRSYLHRASECKTGTATDEVIKEQANIEMCLAKNKIIIKANAV
jgi:hypothetical protein